MALTDNRSKIQALIDGINALPDAGSGEAPADPVLQEKSATPTKATQSITPDAGYDGLSKVTVAPIPDEYIAPSGTKSITANGTHDVAAYESVSVSVPTPEPALQEKTATPTTSSQTVTPDAAYDGLSKVTVNAMPTAAQATPAISVSSSGLITASATQTAGYVAAGTKSGTKQLTVQAAKTITPSKSAQTAVESGRYTTGAVTVAAIPSQYEDVTSPLADLNAANGGTAASTMAGAVDNTEALADTHAGLIAQIATALEGKAAGGGGSGGTEETCAVTVTIGYRTVQAGTMTRYMPLATALAYVNADYEFVYETFQNLTNPTTVPSSIVRTISVHKHDIVICQAAVGTIALSGGVAAGTLSHSDYYVVSGDGAITLSY